MRSELEIMWLEVSVAGWMTTVDTVCLLRSVGLELQVRPGIRYSVTPFVFRKECP